MKTKIISFDLQGTISKSDFSDEFWIELLPQLYAEQQRITIDKAKVELSNRFKEYGKYDYRYYSPEYWISELQLPDTVSDLFNLLTVKPEVFPQTIEVIKDLSKQFQLIIISSTTHDFIEHELGVFKEYFSYIFSSLEDFGIAGKPYELYLKVAEKLEVKPEEILHIGDNLEMDVDNAVNAGLKAILFRSEYTKENLIERIEKGLD